MAGERQRKLADHLEALDATRFVGRRAALTRVEQLLAGNTPVRVVLLHGPGGIGKSTLLREVRRRAHAMGRRTLTVDARTIDPTPDALRQAVREVQGEPGAVLMIDSFERIRAAVRPLQSQLADLAADALVVVARRGAPDRAWFRSGWEHVVSEIPLGPLSGEEATDLLAARGVTDPATVTRLVHWAGGSPLALSLASAAVGQRPETAADDIAAGPLDHTDLNHLVISRLATNDLGEVDRDVLEVAAVARAVDARLLATVLPGRPTRAAYEALRRSHLAELVGPRVTLHDLVRNALRDDLRRRDPRRYSRLRCAIADHLLARALASGEARLLADMIELVDDPEVRWGIGGDSMTRVHVDTWGNGDVDSLIDTYIAGVGLDNWESLAPLLQHAPEIGLVARDADDQPVAFCVAMVAAETPGSWAKLDPHLAPLLTDANHRGNPARTMIFREAFQAPSPAEASGVAPLGSMARSALTLAAVLRSGVANVERSYIVVTRPTDEALAFLKAVNAVRHPELDGASANGQMQCWIIEHGPGGMIGQTRQVIYAEAGVAPADAPRPDDEQLLAAALAAVRDFRRHEALATNLLVEGASRTGAVEGVLRLKALVAAAVDRAFAATEDDSLLRRVVELGDLDPEANHTQAMTQLSMSRATYFRHLRRARERVARVLVDEVARST